MPLLNHGPRRRPHLNQGVRRKRRQSLCSRAGAPRQVPSSLGAEGGGPPTCPAGPRRGPAGCPALMSLVTLRSCSEELNEWPLRLEMHVGSVQKGRQGDRRGHKPRMNVHRAEMEDTSFSHHSGHPPLPLQPPTSGVRAPVRGSHSALSPSHHLPLLLISGFSGVRPSTIRAEAVLPQAVFWGRRTRSKPVLQHRQGRGGPHPLE